VIDYHIEQRIKRHKGKFALIQATKGIFREKQTNSQQVSIIRISAVGAYRYQLLLAAGIIIFCILAERS
jgi:hypothetical protein